MYEPVNIQALPYFWVLLGNPLQLLCESFHNNSGSAYSEPFLVLNEINLISGI